MSISVPSASAEEPTGTTYKIGWLMVIDWDSDYPAAPYYLSIHPDKPSDWTILYEPVWFSDIQAGECLISEYDLIVTTGHAYYAYTAEQREILEEYVRSGGILWFDDCGGIEIDNLPFGYEIDFGYYHLGWGYAYNSPTVHDYTIDQPTHPLMDGQFTISSDHIRDDRNTRWFSPFVSWDSHYEVVLWGTSETHYGSGPAVLATQVGYGKMIATAMDVSCALEANVYGGWPATRFDYHLVMNMLDWSTQPVIKNYDVSRYVPAEGDTYYIGSDVPAVFYAEDEFGNPVDDDTFFLEIWKGTVLIDSGLEATISNGYYITSWDTSGMTEGMYTMIADFEGYCSQEPVSINLELTIPVLIDIKPGSDPNSINLGSRGTVPVAILSTQDFDATTVD
jgi:hypothetical protein